MSVAQLCGACMTGTHADHNPAYAIVPGVLGGAYCPCQGECAEAEVPDLLGALQASLARARGATRAPSTAPVPTDYPAELPALTRAQLAGRRDAVTGLPVLALVELGEALVQRHQAEAAWTAALNGESTPAERDAASETMLSTVGRVRDLLTKSIPAKGTT